MQRPDARVILFKLKDEVTLSWDNLDIASLRVAGIDDSFPVPTSGPDIQDEHVMLRDVSKNIPSKNWEYNSLHEDGWDVPRKTGY